MEPFSLVINAFISLFLLALSGMIVISQSLTGVLVICVAMVIVGFLIILLGKDGNKIVAKASSIYLGRYFAVYNLFSRIGAILVVFGSFSVGAKIVVMNKDDLTIDILMLMAYAIVVGIVTVIIRKRDAKIEYEPDLF
jgi:hypothetical protein